MASSTPFSFFLVLVLFLSFILTNAEFINTAPSKKTTLKRKLSHLHFYFHDIVSGRNPSAVTVMKPANNSFFGMMNMMDDPLTENPDPSSLQVGRAQGMYANADQQGLGFLQAMNLYFTHGKYNGSVLTVLGRNPALEPVREMPVVGGSGLFRFANGFALARTHWIDLKTGDAIVEYNVTVMHY